MDCILGDKLTAFAPNTTGIPFGIGKELEIIKQMHDVASLFEVFENIEDVKRTYITTAKMELDFRGLSIDYKECLKDTIKSCLCIMAKNKIKSDDYKLYLTGIRKIRNHMIGYDFNPDIAADQASKVLYLCTCLLTDSKFEKIIDTENYKKVNKLPDKLKSLMYLKRFNIQAFAYFVESMNLYKLEELI